MPQQECRVLVVDDEQSNRDMLSRRLRKLGYRAGEAVDGQAAVRMVKTRLFDIMLLDIMMPGMDGMQVLEQLREGDKPLPIPVIMLTAVNDKEQVVRALKLGARDYVVKPFDIKDLDTRIQRAMATTNPAGG